MLPRFGKRSPSFYTIAEKFGIVRSVDVHFEVSLVGKTPLASIARSAVVESIELFEPPSSQVREQ